MVARSLLLSALGLVVAASSGAAASAAFTVPRHHQAAGQRRVSTTTETARSTWACISSAVNARAQTSALGMAAESEVSFGELDGSNVRVGIIKTRWNNEHVSNLVEGAKRALKECNVKDDNVFETEVPGSYELPLAAKFLAMSNRVDAVICCGVLIKGDTYHFEYICDAVSSGIMSVNLQTSTPCIFGVLTCANEEQVVKRSTGDNNHGYDWGKTAVEMALLRTEALGMKGGKAAGMGPMGFGEPKPLDDGSKKEKKVGFF